MSTASSASPPRLRLPDADWPMLAAGALALLLLMLALLAPSIAPLDPDRQSLMARLRPPLGFDRADPRFWLGTDQLGRDMLSRCLHGLRLSLFLALFGTLTGLVIGTLLGMAAALGGRIADALIMGLVDVKLSLPFTLVALVVIALAGSSVPVLVLVLGIAYWAHFARLVRAQIMALRELPYVEAARSAGASGWRLARVHMLPNIASPIVVMTTLNFSNLILLESALSFLGLGVQPPTATLGSMVGQGRDYMASAPWIVAAPGLLIVIVSLTVMLLGDHLRDRLDVRLRDR
ncbi:ABC transporter permease [Pseudoroseomonas globiformis]|uniref:ABC transporter permease n=1 Tax=Teichococcus globiformis TaxID=2307229 RepID=A0ABV7FXL6_9PROT